MKIINHIVLILIVLVMLPLGNAFGQCAMCRATIENNVSNGDIGIGASLNFGILYLFVTPYLLIGIVGFLWYRNSKANAKKIQLNKSHTRR